MKYELVNMSDPYTMIADDHKVAFVSATLISTTMTVTSEDGEFKPSIPAFAGGMDYIQEVLDTDDVTQFIKDNISGVIDFLDSVALGTFDERDAYDAKLLEFENLDGRDVWRKKYLDEKRSSMNDIGSYAWDLANQLRENYDV